MRLFKNTKRKLISLTCAAVLAVGCAVPAFADEANQGINSDVAVGLTKAVADQLIMYGRYESISKGSLYEAALNKLLEEDPEAYETALKGMLESIDEHSEYYTPEEGKELMENIIGSNSGIGVTIDFMDGNARIASVIPDTPAEKVGLQVGDILINADGTDLRGLNSEMILNYVRGEIGTTVHLTVDRNGNQIEFDLVREAIVGRTSVTSQIFNDGDKKLMYIRIHGFISNTAEKFAEALSSADKEGIINLIIDVRSNGGGIFDQAINIADNFVPKGSKITTEDHKITLLNKVYTGTKVDKNKYNVVLLQNEYSASASEVLSAALKENGVSYTIGTLSYGKGTIQSINQLMTGGMVKYTSGFYLTPNGNNINGVGIEPDESVDNTTKSVDMSKYADFKYTTVYKNGDKSDEIKTAKEMLSFLGLYSGEINDEFDNDMYYAVYAFQKQVKVFPYGVMDITTQIQLRNYMATVKVEHDNQLEAAFEHFGMKLPEE